MAKDREKDLARKRKWHQDNKEKANTDRAIRAIADKYNVSKDTAIELYKRSMNTCDCCGTKWDGNNHRLHVDHCHETGKVRGILCHACNTSLGLLKESVNRMEQLISYTKEVCIKIK